MAPRSVFLAFFVCKDKFPQLRNSLETPFSKNMENLKSPQSGSDHLKFSQTTFLDVWDEKNGKFLDWPRNDSNCFKVT